MTHVGTWVSVDVVANRDHGAPTATFHYRDNLPLSFTATDLREIADAVEEATKE